MPRQIVISKGLVERNTMQFLGFRQRAVDVEN